MVASCLRMAPEERKSDDPERMDTRELAVRAHAGDSARFAELYERIAPSLYTWAELRIRPELRQWVDPGDVVQEVWCRAWKVFGTFQ